MLFLCSCYGVLGCCYGVLGGFCGYYTVLSVLDGFYSVAKVF